MGAGRFRAGTTGRGGIPAPCPNFPNDTEGAFLYTQVSGQADACTPFKYPSSAAIVMVNERLRSPCLPRLSSIILIMRIRGGGYVPEIVALRVSSSPGLCTALRPRRLTMKVDPPSEIRQPPPGLRYLRTRSTATPQPRPIARFCPVDGSSKTLVNDSE